jgi:activating signal cointegrator 1
VRTKAISLWQPYATLIAIEAKHCETRSWGANYRGLVVIHAAKSNDSLFMINEQPFRSVLASQQWHDINDIPRGVAVTMIRLDQ